MKEIFKEAIFNGIMGAASEVGSVVIRTIENGIKSRNRDCLESGEEVCVIEMQSYLFS